MWLVGEQLYTLDPHLCVVPSVNIVYPARFLHLIEQLATYVTIQQLKHNEYILLHMVSIRYLSV